MGEICVICKTWGLAEISLTIFSSGAFCNPEQREQNGNPSRIPRKQETRPGAKVGMLGIYLWGGSNIFL